MARSAEIEALKFKLENTQKKMIMAMTLAIEEYATGDYERAAVMQEYSVQIMRQLVQESAILKHGKKSTMPPQ